MLPCFHGVLADIASQDDEDRGSVGDLIWADMGSGVPFMPGTFDGAIRFVNWFFGILSIFLKRSLGGHFNTGFENFLGF